MTSPVVKPGDKFTYKLSLMRAESFIYHSHLDDIEQLRGGLYGPLIVIGENEEYNPKKDHFYIVSAKKHDQKTGQNRDLNGWDKPPMQHTFVSETHRIR